jgi:hypothetical protein
VATRTRRVKHLRGVTLPAPLRRSKAGGTMPSICLDCMEPIDLTGLAIAIKLGNIYVHTCGRRLYP